MELTLGDTTLRLYLTPGHTLGTISTVFPVRDGGVPHMAAVWGGTLFNFRDTPQDPRDLRLQGYAESAVRFRAIAREAGVDVILSNHTRYDASTVKLPVLSGRRPGDPHPYVVGVDGVSRFLTVAEECALATRLAERATPN
jgi:metallo-beta-lactamase class B